MTSSVSQYYVITIEIVHRDSVMKLVTNCRPANTSVRTTMIAEKPTVML